MSESLPDTSYISFLPTTHYTDLSACQKQTNKKKNNIARKIKNTETQLSLFMYPNGSGQLGCTGLPYILSPPLVVQSLGVAMHPTKLQRVAL